MLVIVLFAGREYVTRRDEGIPVYRDIFQV